MLQFMGDYAFTHKPVAQNSPEVQIFRMPLWKRTFDIAASLSAILLLSPLLIVVAAAIKLDSPGPVVYKSKRVGSNYRIFDFLKFRSMRTDADRRLKELGELNQYAAQPQEADSGKMVLGEEEMRRLLEDTQNGMLTYAAVCAQNLDADFNCFSLSGWTVYRRVDIENGGDCAVPPVYGQIAPLNGNAAPWDFSRFQPGVVVVALGTNDSSYIALGQAEADTFSRKYREFLQQLRGCYPAAAIVCTVGMMNPTSFAHIERAVRAFGDENVYTHKERFCRSTHPIAADHKQAGDALSALIARIKGWN